MARSPCGQRSVMFVYFCLLYGAWVDALMTVNLSCLCPQLWACDPDLARTPTGGRLHLK